MYFVDGHGLCVYEYLPKAEEVLHLLLARLRANALNVDGVRHCDGVMEVDWREFNWLIVEKMEFRKNRDD